MTQQLLALSSDELIARLDEALATLVASGPGRPIVAFDADGTLWSGDVGDELLDAIVRKRAVRQHAGAALSQTARDHGVAVSRDALEQADLLYEAYRAHKLPEPVAYAMAGWIFAGFRADELYRFAEEVLLEGEIDGRLQREVEPVFAWARQRGVEIFAVSASPTAIVEQGVGRVGIVRRNVLATSPLYEDGVVIADVHRPIPYADGKVAAIERVIPDALLVGAFGDNTFDISMMCRAHVAGAVRPKAGLLARAGEVPHLIELARPAL